ncbi:sigma factor-like helix-turn-helix DNA-binding protein [Actinoplanes sp. NPDC049596]|uniref:sigma factor-like helix-turn-helix DNA-binding protein n=1 Tax=unclassified Actinoplanes TaxID=2626549 RepID=UPI00341C7DEC
MSTTPADAIAAQRPAIELMLLDLSAAHREILLATHFAHRTTTEAAERLGLPPAEVKARLYYAMRELSYMLCAASARR